MPRKIESKNLIVKSNHLIEAKYRLTSGEQKILYKLITTINKDDEDFKPYDFKISEFMKLIGVNNGNLYKEVKIITSSLTKRGITIYDECLRTLTQATWLSSAVYHENLGVVTLRFDPTLKPYLLQMKGNFTKLDITNLLQLRSGYSLRIYELLKRYEYENKPKEFTIEELRNMLGIGENEYPFYANFKKKIIDTAHKEINKKTDLSFDYQEIKQSRKVNSIRFIIITKTQNESVDIETENIFNITSNEVIIEIKEDFKKLYNGSLLDNFVEEMILRKGYSYVKDCIRNYSDYLNGRNISNVSGDFYTFVMKGYEKPTSYRGNIPNYANFEQRKYSEEELEKVYDNLSD